MLASYPVRPDPTRKRLPTPFSNQAQLHIFVDAQPPVGELSAPGILLDRLPRDLRDLVREHGPDPQRDLPMKAALIPTPQQYAGRLPAPGRRVTPGDVDLRIGRPVPRHGHVESD